MQLCFFPMTKMLLFFLQLQISIQKTFLSRERFPKRLVIQEHVCEKKAAIKFLDFCCCSVFLPTPLLPKTNQHSYFFTDFELQSLGAIFYFFTLVLTPSYAVPYLMIFSKILVLINPCCHTRIFSYQIRCYQYLNESNQKISFPLCNKESAIYLHCTHNINHLDSFLRSYFGMSFH